MEFVLENVILIIAHLIFRRWDIDIDKSHTSLSERIHCTLKERISSIIGGHPILDYTDSDTCSFRERRYKPTLPGHYFK